MVIGIVDLPRVTRRAVHRRAIKDSSPVLPATESIDVIIPLPGILQTITKVDVESTMGRGLVVCPRAGQQEKPTLT